MRIRSRPNRPAFRASIVFFAAGLFAAAAIGHTVARWHGASSALASVRSELAGVEARGAHLRLHAAELERLRSRLAALAASGWVSDDSPGSWEVAVRRAQRTTAL